MLYSYQNTVIFCKKLAENPSLIKRIIIDDKIWVIHHEFIPQDQAVMEEDYLNVLKRLREAIRRIIPNWLAFLIKHETRLIAQLSYSPNLAICNFFLFSKLKIRGL